MKSKSSRPTRGGGRPLAVVEKEIAPFDWVKIWAQKKGSVPPDFSQEDRGASEQSFTRFYFLEWICGMLLSITSSEREAARSAQSKVYLMLEPAIERLLMVARDSSQGAAQGWAGELLAYIGARISIEDKSLREANAVYRDWKLQVGKKLASVMYPGSDISRAVQSALRMARGYQMLLRCFGPDDWEREPKIPRFCWCLRGFPPFSLETESLWWPVVWRIIKEKFPSLLAKLRRESHSDAARKKKARWATFRRQCRQHLQILARNISRGVR